MNNFQIRIPTVLKSTEKGESVEEILRRPRKPGRILLIVPSQVNVYGMNMKLAYPSLGILWVASTLEKAGHKVSIIDMDADNMDRIDKIYKIFEKESYDVVGLTAVTSTYISAVNIAKNIKKRFSITTVLGGIHATVDSMACAEEKAFDFIVVGEGECTVIELVDNIMEGVRDFSHIKGLVYREKDGEIVSTGERKLASNLDDFPFPARHLIRNPSNYEPIDATFLPVAPIIVSRGCPGRCTYCQVKNIFGFYLRFRSPQNVIEEIRELVYKYKVKEIHFLDDVFTANRNFILKFCSLLKEEPYKLHLEVPNGLRPDMVDEKILMALKEVGLRNVRFGIETGNERVSKLIKKDIKKDRVREVMSLSKKLGLGTWGFFMIGLPGDDEKSIMDTINFAIELDPKIAKFPIFKPFPGSEAYFQIEKEGLIDERDLSHYGAYTYPVHHLKTLSRERIKELQQLAFRKFYFRPGKIFEHLKDITTFRKFISILRGFFFVVLKAFKKSDKILKRGYGEVCK